VYTPVVWKLSTSHRLHIFLWLLSNNKILTRDNLSKRQHVDDPSCLFCDDMETTQHLLFGCCVDRVMWCNLAEILGKNLGNDFESIARYWLCYKKYKTVNICTTMILWTLWKMRNFMCFQVNQWFRMQRVFFRCAKMLRGWCGIQKEEVASQLGKWCASGRKEVKSSDVALSTNLQPKFRSV
jgi:hypothetical protein